MSDTLENTEERLQKQIEHINDAITKIRQNELLDISAMDSDIAALCKNIMHTENGTAKKMENKVIEMINLLDTLSVELKAYQDRINPKN